MDGETLGNVCTSRFRMMICTKHEHVGLVEGCAACDQLLAWELAETQVRLSQLALYRMVECGAVWYEGVERLEDRQPGQDDRSGQGPGQSAAARE